MRLPEHDAARVVPAPGCAVTPEREKRIRDWYDRTRHAQTPFPWREDVADLLSEIDRLRTQLAKVARGDAAVDSRRRARKGGE